MKKSLLLVAIMFIGAVTSTATAQKKKDKNKKAVPVAAKRVELQTPSDTLSYASGAALTGGLPQYLRQHYNISNEQMPDFMRGLEEGLQQRKDASFSAYSAGLAIADQVSKQMIPNVKSQFEGTGVAINEALLLQGFVDVLKNDTTYFTQAKAQEYFEGRRTALKEAKDMANKTAGERFLSENAKKEGVVTTASGLQYKVIQKGTGAIPTKDDKVTVVYEGRTIDGKVFDATEKHGTESDTFGVGGLIKGWTEALTLMPVGSKWELYIPQELAYGARGAGQDIAPYSTLIFTLELKGIEKPQAASTVKSASSTSSVGRKTTKKEKK